MSGKERVLAFLHDVSLAGGSLDGVTAKQLAESLNVNVRTVNHGREEFNRLSARDDGSTVLPSRINVELNSSNLRRR